MYVCVYVCMYVSSVPLRDPPTPRSLSATSCSLAASQMCVVYYERIHLHLRHVTHTHTHTRTHLAANHARTQLPPPLKLKHCPPPQTPTLAPQPLPHPLFSVPQGEIASSSTTTSTTSFLSNSLHHSAREASCSIAPSITSSSRTFSAICACRVVVVYEQKKRV